MRRASGSCVPGWAGTHRSTLLHEWRGAEIRAEARLMFQGERPTGSKQQIYRELSLQARGLFEGERDAVANAANLAALIYSGLADINWAGFYLLKGDELVLGPFQGKPAC